MNKYVISIHPHHHSRNTIERIMWGVVLALLPTVIASIIFFRSSALIVIACSVAGAVISEYIYRSLLKRSLTITDGSAVVTGLLFAAIVPATVPWWIPALGSSIAIILVKEAFGGGLGKNMFNPALAAYAVLALLFPYHMSITVTPFTLVTATTEPSLMQNALVPVSSLWDLFIGNHAGSLAATSDLAILIGGLLLVKRAIIAWQYPVCFIATFCGVSALCGHAPLTELLTGPVMLCAFFMVTDTVTTPVTRRGGIIFSVAAAALAAVLRIFCTATDSLCYSILALNACVPAIDRWTRSRIFGSSGAVAIRTPRDRTPSAASAGASTDVARLLCCGGSAAVDECTYVGIRSCRAAVLAFQGQKFCKFGCLGFGDCRAACPFGAIHMSPDMLPIIDEKKCVACGACVTACPKQLIEIHDRSRTVFVQCKSHDKGAIVRKICSRGCTGCEQCIPTCPVNAISMINNCAVVDQAKCTRCGACVRICPTRVLVDHSS